MATKFDTVMDALQTALAGLVTDGTFKAVKREIIIPATEHDLPVFGLYFLSWRQADPIWIGECLCMIVAEAGAVTGDERPIELSAKVHGAWNAAKGSLGGSIDLPRWEAWADITEQGRTHQNVGARGLLRIRVEDPILIEE